MSIRNPFSNSIDLIVINEYDKSVGTEISGMFGPFTMLLVEGYSETILFRDLSDHVIGGRNFENRKSMRVIFFFKIFKI